MRRQGIFIPLSFLLALALAACSAPQPADGTLGVLGGAHFASSTLTRGSLIASFTVQGIGNPDKSGYSIGLVGTADLVATCSNKGTNVASGVNDVEIGTDLALPTTGSIDHNGNFTGSVTLPDFAIDDFSSQGVCKNRNWTITRLQTRWTSAVLTVHKPDAEPDDEVCFVITKDDGNSLEFSTVSCAN